MIEIVQSPNVEKNINGKNSIKIFIAGGISNCPNWQKTLIERLVVDNRIENTKDVNITIFNPRCKEEPDDEYTQILWEFNKLKKSDIISFWFSEGSVNPITLFEYGAHFNTDKTLVVGYNPKYIRKNDIKIQTKLYKPFLKIKESFDDFYEELVKTIIKKIKK